MEHLHRTGREITEPFPRKTLVYQEILGGIILTLRSPLPPVSSMGRKLNSGSAVAQMAEFGVSCDAGRWSAVAQMAEFGVSCDAGGWSRC